MSDDEILFFKRQMNWILDTLQSREDKHGDNYFIAVQLLKCIERDFTQ
jgi:hypothetical protein